MNCLVKQFAMCFGVVAIFVPNVMDVFSVGGGALLDRLYHVWSSKECAYCTCDPSVLLVVVCCL